MYITSGSALATSGPNTIAIEGFQNGGQNDIQALVWSA